VVVVMKQLWWWWWHDCGGDEMVVVVMIHCGGDDAIFLLTCSTRTCRDNGLFCPVDLRRMSNLLSKLYLELEEFMIISRTQICLFSFCCCILFSVEKIIIIK
jgi:hypothetical protein